MNLIKLPSVSSEMHQTLNVHIWKFKVVNIRHLDISRNYMTSYYVTIYFSADLRLCTEPDNGWATNETEQKKIACNLQEQMKPLVTDSCMQNIIYNQKKI